MSHQILHLVELWPSFINLCKDPLLASSTDKTPKVSNSHASNHSNHTMGWFLNHSQVFQEARLHGSFLTESSGGEDV